MAVDLLTLEPQRISKDLKGKFMLLYGLPKVGKTTLASQLDKVFIASFEPGTNGLDNVLTAPMITWEDWRKTVRQLVKDKDKLANKIGVIAIDTADEAYKLCEKWVCNQNGIEQIRDIPYGGGYKLLDDEFASTLRTLAFAGYGLFFISHSKEKTLKNDKGQEYNQINPALPDRAFNIINKMVDMIIYLRQVDIQEEEQILHKRYLFFRGDERFYAGSRFAYIVPRVELSYKNLLDSICNAIDEEKKAKGGGEASTEENPYYKLDYDNLIQEAATYWAQVADKGLTGVAAEILEKEFGKKIKFSEIPRDKVESMSKVLFEIKELLNK